MRVIPLSAYCGALALILADLVARVVMAPEDMPIGAVTGLVGGVAFIAILKRRAAALEHFAVRWNHLTAKCGKNKQIERKCERM